MAGKAKRVESTLRFDKEEANIAKGMVKPRNKVPAAKHEYTDDHLRQTFTTVVSTHVAVEFKEVMKTQGSVTLQRIWSRVVDGTRDLAILRPVYAAFSEQMSLSDESAKRLWDWVKEGGLAKKANGIYDSALTYLERTGCSVPSHRGGDLETKRGRVTCRK